MEDRSDRRGGLGAADRADRRRDDRDGSLREDRAGRLTMARLELDNLSKRYGDHAAVAGVTLDVADGEFVVLLGPSGCGKTTTLRMIAGFVEPSGGAARIGGVDVTWLPPWRRNTGMVVQSYAVVPHMTGAENVPVGRETRARDNGGTPGRARATRWGGCGSRPTPRDARASFPAVSSSASRWRACWRSVRTCCCSTSRSPISTPSCARRCASRSANCSASST